MDTDTPHADAASASPIKGTPRRGVMTPFTEDCEGFTLEGAVMPQTLPKGKCHICGLDDDTPVKCGIPASANQQGYLENEIYRIQKLYQLRQRLVQTAVKELSRVLPETAQRPNSRVPWTGTRVRAASTVEPCGRVFHRVEQSPESKECQRLQQSPTGTARSQGTCRHCVEVMPSPCELLT